MYHKKFFFVNSANRLSGTNSNFTYELKGLKESGIKYDRCVVKSASIPKSYYVCQDGFNTFTLREDGVDYKVTIQPGTYNRTTFARQFPAIMSTVSALAYTCTFSNGLTTPETGKYIFGMTTGHTASFIFGTDLYELFGFDANSTNTFANDTLNSTNVVKFVPEDVLLLKSNIVADTGSNILQDFYAQGSPDYSNIVYSCANHELESKTIAPVSSNVYTFELTSEGTDHIDLNGLNMVFSMCVWKSTPDTIIQPAKVEIIKSVPIKVTQ